MSRYSRRRDRRQAARLVEAVQRETDAAVQEFRARLIEIAGTIHHRARAMSGRPCFALVDTFAEQASAAKATLMKKYGDNNDENVNPNGAATTLVRSINDLIREARSLASSEVAAALAPQLRPIPQGVRMPSKLDDADP